ncbi:WD40 repeat domain-containing protein [Streptomyces sp. NPDC054956]
MSNSTEFQASLDQFAEQLRRLKADRGNPTLEKIVSRAARAPGGNRLSKSTLSGAFKGKHLQRVDGLMCLVRTLLSYDADGRYRAVEHRAPELELWRSRWRDLEELRRTAAQTGAPVPAEPLGRAVSPMAVRALACMLGQGRVLPLPPLRGPAESYDAVAFSPDGRFLALGGYDGTVYLQDPVTGAEAAGPLVGHGDIVRDLSFSGDGQWLASVADDGAVWLWDLTYRNPVGGRLPDGYGARDVVAVSPDGRTVAAGRSHGLVDVWDTATRERVTTLNTGFWSEALAFSPDGSLLAAAGSKRALRLWSTATWHPAGDTIVDGCHDLAFSPDGRLLAAATSHGSVELWDPLALGSGSPVVVFPSTSTDVMTSVAFSPDGRFLAGAGLDGVVRLWRSDGMLLDTPLETPSKELYCIAFSPDGGLLAAVGDTDQVQVWIPPHGNTG